jgi:hypothetical protein
MIDQLAIKDRVRTFLDRASENKSDFSCIAVLLEDTTGCEIRVIAELLQAISLRAVVANDFRSVQWFNAGDILLGINRDLAELLVTPDVALRLGVVGVFVALSGRLSASRGTSASLLSGQGKHTQDLVRRLFDATVVADRGVSQR